MPLSRVQSRQLAQLVAVGRLALGVTAIALPQVPLRPWVGDRRTDQPALVLARALGGRDVALGLGAVLAMRHDAPLRGWVEAGGLADTGDAVFTLLAFRHLPAAGRWAVLAAAGGGALAARLAARGVDLPVLP
jgi:hypothetical protein